MLNKFVLLSQFLQARIFDKIKNTEILEHSCRGINYEYHSSKNEHNNLEIDFTN